MSKHALREIREEMRKYWVELLTDDDKQERLLDEFNHEYSFVGGLASCPDLEKKLKELKKTDAGRKQIKEIILRVKEDKPHILYKPKKKKKLAIAYA